MGGEQGDVICVLQAGYPVKNRHARGHLSNPGKCDGGSDREGK